jgi:hypothetical protein
MSRRPYSNGQPDSLICQHLACNNVSSYISLVEKAILDELSEILSGYKLQWSTETKPDNKTTRNITTKKKSITKLQKELEHLDNQRKRTHELLERDVYDTETFIQRSHEIAEDKFKTEQALNELINELKMEEAREQVITSIIPTVETILGVYHKLPNAKAKNDLMREVIDRVVYTKNQGGRWSRQNTFDIVIYTKLPIKSE